MYPSVNHPINCGLASTLSFSNYAKQKISDDSFSIVSSVINRVTTSGMSSVVSYQDQVLNRQTSTEYVTDFRIDKIFNKSIYNRPIVFSSSDPSVLTVSPDGGIASYQNDGYCTITAKSEDGETSAIGLYANKTYPGNTDTFTSWTNTSLAKNITDSIDLRIDGKTSNSSKPIFSTRNNSSNIYNRNIDCWVADLDLTCISPWNSSGGSNMAGVLISPRHVLFAAHYQPSAGTTIKYITQNNIVISRTITALQTDPSYTPYYPDIAVGVLDSDIPNTISFAKILPPNWTSYLPSIAHPKKLPVLITDQEKKAMIADLYAISNYVTLLRPIDASRLAFYEDIIGGDSGSPSFLIINNQLVLLTVWTSASQGTFVTTRKDVINTMMSNLGGGYQLTEINLSLFPSY